MVAVNDMLAFGLLAGFRDAGLSVPRDVSVIGIDGLYLSSLTSPGLTTVSLPVPEMARTMVERLIARLADAAVAPGEFLFKPSLVQRESVAAAARGSARRLQRDDARAGVPHARAERARQLLRRARAGRAARGGRRALHDSEAPWTLDALAAAAADCDIIVSDRRAEAPAALLQRLPKLVAFVRCAVDIRNIDVPAASAHGILVTQASAGFMASVAEWVIGVMIDLSRGISASVQQYRSGATPVPRMGRELRGSTLGVIGYGQIGRHLGRARPRLRHARAGQRPARAGARHGA